MPIVEGEEGRAELARLWPMAGMPVLRDGDLVLPESTTIIEYLGGLVPDESGAALQARLWDRFADNHLSTPMQKIAADELRPEGGRDPVGVAEERQALDTAYGVLDARLADRRCSTCGRSTAGSSRTSPATTAICWPGRRSRAWWTRRGRTATCSRSPGPPTRTTSSPRPPRAPAACGTPGRAARPGARGAARAGG